MPRTRSTTCYECGAKLTTPGAFCTPTHKAAFHNRRAKRGALLLDVEVWLRKLKDGRRASLATRRDLLWLKWEAEDTAAGRRSMTRALEDVQYDNELPREYELERYDIS